MDGLYINKDLCLLDFSKEYFKSYEDLLNSEELSYLLESFVLDLESSNHILYKKLNELSKEPISFLIKIVKLLCVMSLEEISLNHDKKIILELVEEIYNFYRKKARFSLIYADTINGLNSINFMEADSEFNNMVLNLYRLVEEKLMGTKNLVYRQLQAGSNAALLLVKKENDFKDEYKILKDVPFIHKTMLRTPLILHTDYNSRKGTFLETFNNPINNIKDLNDFLCIPILVGESLTFIYFHKDFCSSAIGLTNLFELAPLERLNDKPDSIMLFGVKDDLNEQVFYVDETNDLVVGKLSYSEEIEYFGYFKKMALTLHNIRMIKEGKLPIHGAMFNIYFKDGISKGVVLMGDSGAGKSETLETLTKVLGKDISKIEIIFDDMGSMYEINNKIYASGTETGAFIRLDDLGNETIYRDIDRSIFINPESSKNARVITPKTPYEIVKDKHIVDIFLYANNYEDAYGIKRLDAKEAIKVYKEGKRFALGTTNEKGISKTYFANPFGPMQKQNETDIIIDKIFKVLEENDVCLGEIYTRLKYHDDGIVDASKELIKLIRKD